MLHIAIGMTSFLQDLAKELRKDKDLFDSVSVAVVDDDSIESYSITLDNPVLKDEMELVLSRLAKKYGMEMEKDEETSDFINWVLYKN